MLQDIYFLPDGLSTDSFQKQCFATKVRFRWLGKTNTGVKFIIHLQHKPWDLSALVVLSHDICAQYKRKQQNIRCWILQIIFGYENFNIKFDIFCLIRHPSHPISLYTSTCTDRMTISNISCQESYWKTNTCMQEQSTAMTTWERSLRTRKLRRYKWQ
jgi:hypothetical protein